MTNVKENGKQITPTSWNFAIFMAKQGRKVFPIQKHDKKPLIKGWQEHATGDEATIRAWSLQHPDSNYGVVTGEGFFVIDIDVDDPAGIDAEIDKLREELGSFELGTVVKTGQGCQLYCASSAVPIRNSTKRLTDNVDVKGEGGYVVGVGSIHPNGQRYAFSDALTLETGIVLTRLPKAALQYIASLNGSKPDREGAAKKRVREENADDNQRGALNSSELISKGQRNDTLFRLGCRYREVYGLDGGDLYAILVDKNRRCDPPLEVDELRAISQRCATYAPGVPRHVTTEVAKTDEFAEAVLNLFQDNRFIDLVRRNVQKFHVGDEPVTELLMVSVASMSVVNTKGTQPKLSGESGMGKTHAVQAIRHLMHPTMCKSASFSAKALFYDDSVRPKMIIFSDDVTLAPDVEATVRAAMTDWNTPTEHITLDGKRNPITLSLPPRIIFWLTSVDNKSTTQLQNRQVEINVDETPDQDKRVARHQRKRAELGLPEFYDDEEVDMLREAFLHLNKMDFTVKIPFVDNIGFSDEKNRRNLDIFLDLVRGYCVLNYGARQADDDGKLIATKEDFDNALELFKTVAVQQVTKLNPRERELADVIKENSPCDVDIMMDETGLSRSRISELLHGDKDSQNKGMLEKIPELKFHSRSDFDPEGNRWGRNHYSLPNDWSIVRSHESIVYWIDDAIDTDDDGVDQFRSVSGSFGGEYRNSSEDVEDSDDDLDPGLGVCSSTHTTCFGTSIERETQQTTNGSSPAVTPVRNTETAPHTSADTGAADSTQATDLQSGTLSVSESPSEVARNATEAAHVSQDPEDTLDYLIERAVTAIEITHRGQCLASDTLVAYVANKVQEIDGSCDRDTIKKRFLVLAQEHEEVGRRVDLVTKGEFPLQHKKT